MRRNCSAQPVLGATRFVNGDFAVFRLTPDKYHYNHMPVSGRVVDTYGIDGQYHSCNPTALIAMASLYAKNRRAVTIIDTDVPGGTQVGLVAMIEIVALMIGDLTEAYSEEGYNAPQHSGPGCLSKRAVRKVCSDRAVQRMYCFSKRDGSSLPTIWSATHAAMTLSAGTPMVLAGRWWKRMSWFVRPLPNGTGPTCKFNY